MNDATLNLEAISLAKGAHPDRSNGLCVMEVAAWLAGEPHSDSPSCVCPTIRTLFISWNDVLRTDEDRNRLLKPLLALVLNTNTGPEASLRRSWMAFDWLVRENTPAWLDLTPDLAPHAAALRGLGEIVDRGSVDLALPVLRAARAAARDAAWNAARASLAPTTARLQASAQELVRRMCAVGARGSA